MNTLKQLITSSTSPESVSLTVKSLVTLAVLFGFDSAVVNDAGGYLTNLLVAIGMIVSALTGLYGIGRKIKLGRWSASNYTAD